MGSTVRQIRQIAASDKGVGNQVNTGRPVPLFRQAEDALIDVEIWYAESMRDGFMDPHEALQGIPTLMTAKRLLSKIVPMVGHISTCVSGSDGLDSPRAIRGWNEAHARKPDNVIELYPEGDEAA